LTKGQLILTVLWILMSGFVNAQVNFTAIPADLDLIPRDTDSSGTIVVRGENSDPGYNSVHSQLVAMSNQEVVEDKITDIGPDGLFSFLHHIPAKLQEYELHIYLRSPAAELPVKTVKRLVAGDCFIIAGQSNALAAADILAGGLEQQVKYSKPWLRGIGTHHDYLSPQYPCEFEDLNFYQSECNWMQQGFVGTWGLKLQHDLAEYSGIPSCMVNGASAGSGLHHNLASRIPTDAKRIDSCNTYDRLYRKIARHGLAKHVRAIFWYQGETDAGNSKAASCAYLNGFDSLYRSWKLDYPNVEKIFLLQLNEGCNELNVGLLRDIQRRISHKYKDVCTLPTFSPEASDRSDDHCHYTLEGYNKVANNLLPPAKKYLYQAQVDDQAVFAPEIQKIYRSDLNQLCLEFDRDIFVQQFKDYAPLIGIAYLKDYFYGENKQRLALQGITSVKNNLYLNFTPGATLPKKVTYLPDSYTRLPTLYTGPWILNASNTSLPALSFFDYQVSGSSDNGWTKDWSNFESGLIGDHILTDKDLFYKGDFNGDGDEELLCISYDKNNGKGVTHLLDYEDGKWIADETHQLKDTAIFKSRHRIITGDFDADGKDELLINGDPAAGEPAILYKYLPGEWVQVWTDKNNPGHPLRSYRTFLYAVKFNGDGAEVLLGYKPGSEGGLAEFKYNGSDFIPGAWTAGATHPLADLMEQLWTGDYNGDGITDLLTVSKQDKQILFTWQDHDWRSLFPLNGVTSQEENDLFGLGTDYRLMVTGNIDGDAREELMVRRGIEEESSVLFTDLEQGSLYKTGTVANGPPSLDQYINDWPVDGTSGAQYVLIRTEAGKPDRLLAIRHESCGYLANLYVFSGKTSSLRDQLPLQELDSQGLLVYPNPSKGPVNVRFPGRQISTVSVFDLQGRLLLQVDNQVQSSYMDLGFLQKGIYLVKMMNAEQTLVKKLLIEK
jgi:hypothetical protein